MMKIAITGGSGFIGSWFINEYKNRYTIIILGREKELTAINFGGTSIAYRSTDYSVNSLLQCLDGIDCVLHLAARRESKDEQDVFEEYVMANIVQSRNVFEACRIAKITNIVNLSSVLVYGQSDRQPWVETQDTHPETPYGISKLAAEKIAYYYNRRFGLRIKSLRLAPVIGWGDRLRKEHVVMKFIASAVNKKELAIYGNGEGRREYLYIKDAVRALECAIKNGEKSGVYNIGPGTNVSYKELAILINQVFKNEGKIVYLENQNEDRASGLMDISKAKEELGFVPCWDVGQALQDMKKMAGKQIAAAVEGSVD